MPNLSFNNIKVHYILKDKTKIVALDGLTCEFQDKKINVILGESGSGKTTILKCLCDFIDYEGEILLNGKNVDEIETKNRKISYLTQENELLERKNVFDNLALPLVFKKVNAFEIRRRVYEIANEFDIDYLLIRKVRELSKGQQKLISFAKMLLKDSEIYLFDEPFSGVDQNTKERLMEVIKTKFKDKNVIFITHSVKEAMKLGDEIFVISEGKIVDQGDKNQIYCSEVEQTRLLIHAES